MNVQIPVKWLQELLALCGPEDHELRERVMVSITAMDEQTARAVAMPEPDAVVKGKLGEICSFFSASIKKGDKLFTEQQMRALLAGVSAPAAQAVWDDKLPESLQRALNELRIDCKTDAISSLEFEVRSVFEGMHTSLTTVKRMYHAAQKRLDSTDAAQPDPFAAPQAQADARDAALLDFIESHAEGVIRLDAVPSYLYWGKHWEHKTARAAIASAKGEQ